MKKKLFFILLTTLVWGCKRKQNLREFSGSDVLAQGPVTCYNGVKDGDESYVDCGGSCIPCNFPVAPCSPSNNTLKIGNTNYTTSSSFCGNYGGSNYEFSGTLSGGGNYTIKLGVANPDLTTSYTIRPYSGITNKEAYVSIVTFFNYGSFDLSSGTVYITQVAGKYYATICGASGYSTLTSQNQNVEAMVSCP